MAADPTVVDALANTELFGSLGKKQLNRVAESARVVDHDGGKEIASEGREGIGFHLILDGHASVRVHGQDRPQLGPGDYFGEISLIDGKPRSATVIADGSLTTVSIPAWQFQPLLDDDPELSRQLLVGLCARIRRAEQA